MTFRSVAILAILFFLLANSAHSQADKYLLKGDKFFHQKDFTTALRFYDQALEAESTHAEVNLKVAQCYLLSSNKGKALPYACAAVLNTEKPSPELFLTLAQAHHIVHNFDTAIFYYKKADPTNANKQLISKKINECEAGKKYIGSPVDVEITNAGDLVNTKHQEYLPYITADRKRLYFTSRRPGSTGGKKDIDGKFFEDIYACENKGEVWNVPVNIGPPLNSDAHDACIGLSPDGQVMFVYKGSNGGDIYTSKLKGNKWEVAENLPMNTSFFESTACLSPDERNLYFVRKSMGSRDIYMCSKTIGGQWSQPKKIEGINTEFDEDCPFIHPDGKTLYFSSKGHTTMGGYDIFKSTRNAQGLWSAPENLGYPINSSSDEIYFVLSADGKIGFYSSDKEGGFGQQDIYSIRMPPDAGPQMALLKGTVKAADTNQPVEAIITISDNDTKEVVARFNSNEITGEYLVPLPSGKNYGIAIEKAGHLFYSENVSFTDNEGFKEIHKDILLQPVKAGVKVVLKNIFFDSGKADLRPESASELLRLANLLRVNSKINIEISGHTDNVGNAAANQKLSELRAIKVTEYLIKEGISKARLTAKGYGTQQPLEANTTPEGRQTNRRTEVKIL